MPVMVWLHGGGFAVGSGSWGWYDGANLARLGGVVVITINHRLSAFGHLYLGGLDPRFGESGNVGMLDIVRALEWIRDNASAFGGDAGNVTVFGESGGGSKVSTLLAMPPARGLFHKAIVQSGPYVRAVTLSQADALARSIVAAAGISTGELHLLQELPPQKLLEATLSVPGAQLGLSPVTAGSALLADPFSPAAPATSTDVPLLIGSNHDEGGTVLSILSPALGSPAVPDDAAVRQRLEALGVDDGKAERLIAVYRQSRRGASPYEILVAIASDLTMRIGSITEAERKAAVDKAPAYMYLFAWKSPVLGGQSVHALELPFVFGNLDAMAFMTGTGADRAVLADTIGRAWIAFAHSGAPAAPGLPTWPAYEASRRATMILDTQSVLRDDPGRNERLALVDAGLAEWSPQDSAPARLKQ